ncbi:MAG: hypothetical protein R3C05_02905 [Pirellulaceae bacterium]
MGATAGIDVTDDDLLTLTLSIDLGSISENGGLATGNGDSHRYDRRVDRRSSSSDVGEANVPASVTIPGGSDRATFTITGVDDLIVDGVQSAEITVSAATFLAGSVNIDVTDDDCRR